MIFDIKGLGGVKGADKTKAKGKTGSVGGPSFADMLEDAQGVDEASAGAPVVGGMALPAGFVPVEEDLPKDAKGQARELLKTLQGLAEDALSGSPTGALRRLEALANSVDDSELTEAQKQALDEAKTRAAVEAAKLKS